MINSFNNRMKERFGGKVYRLALSCSTTCPNRDGTCGYGGCIFCSEGGSGDFASDYALDIDSQIEKAKEKVASKLSGNFAGYIAYFQAFTSTYGNVSEIRSRLQRAVMYPEILALSVATRPDCLSDDIMMCLSELNKIKPIWVELGLQTIHENTAKLINRGYSLDVYDKAVEKLHDAGIEVITHIIIGLPGEDNEMIKETVKYACDSKPEGIKLQLLHVMKGTALEKMWLENPDIIHNYTLEEYASLLKELMDVIPENITVHRLTGDAPKKLLLHPLWTADKKKVINALNKVLQ